MATSESSSAHSRDSSAREGLLSAAEEGALLVAAQRGDRAATARLVRAHMKLVHAIARRIAGRPCEDTIAEGVVGLLEGIARFDRGRGVRLSTYAAHWIRSRVQGFVLANRGIVASPDTRAARLVFARIGRTRRALAKETGEPTVERLAEALGVDRTDVESVLVALSPRDVPVGSDSGTGHFEPTCRGPTPEDAVLEHELSLARARAIGDVLAAVPPRERRVVELRALSEDARTLDELARELRLSRERVRQLEARALRRIGEVFLERGLAA